MCSFRSYLWPILACRLPPFSHDRPTKWFDVLSLISRLKRLALSIIRNSYIYTSTREYNSSYPEPYVFRPMGLGWRSYHGRINKQRNHALLLEWYAHISARHNARSDHIWLLEGDRITCHRKRAAVLTDSPAWLVYLRTSRRVIEKSSSIWSNMTHSIDLLKSVQAKHVQLLSFSHYYQKVDHGANRDGRRGRK